MSDPDTEAFLGCDAVSSVGRTISSVTWCQRERLSAARTCPLPLRYLFHNEFLLCACAGDSEIWVRSRGIVKTDTLIVLNEFDHIVNVR